MSSWKAIFAGIVTTLIFVTVIFFSYHSGANSTQTKTHLVVQTKLIVPPVCMEALDHGDDIALILGSAIGSAARGQSGQRENLHPLIEEATHTYEQYRLSAARCRQLGRTS